MHAVTEREKLKKRLHAGTSGGGAAGNLPADARANLVGQINDIGRKLLNLLPEYERKYGEKYHFMFAGKQVAYLNVIKRDQLDPKLQKA